MQEQIVAAFAIPAAELGAAERGLFVEFKAGLNEGRFRAAQPDASSPTGWNRR